MRKPASLTKVNECGGRPAYDNRVDAWRQVCGLAKRAYVGGAENEAAYAATVSPSDFMQARKLLSAEPS